MSAFRMSGSPVDAVSESRVLVTAARLSKIRNQLPGDLRTVHLLQMFFDVPGRHAPRIQRQNSGIQISQPTGTLRHDHRLEITVPVPWNRNRYRPRLGLHRFRILPIPGISGTTPFRITGLISEMRGHFHIQGAFEHLLRQLVQKALDAGPRAGVRRHRLGDHRVQLRGVNTSESFCAATRSDFADDVSLLTNHSFNRPSEGYTIMNRPDLHGCHDTSSGRCPESAGPLTRLRGFPQVESRESVTASVYAPMSTRWGCAGPVPPDGMTGTPERTTPYNPASSTFSTGTVPSSDTMGRRPTAQAAVF